MKPDLFIATPFDAERLARFGAKYTVHRSAKPEVRAVLTNGRIGLSSDQMQAMPRLEIICVFGAGHEGVDVAFARARNIAITTGAGANAASVADHGMALLFSLVRGIPQYDRAVKEGLWKDAASQRPMLFGKRLGIVGLGNVGSAVARRAARGFDMAIGYNARRKHDDVPYRYFTTPVELASWSDFMILACPGGRETHHLMNAEVLSALGPSGFLVNVARGSVLDTAALLEALRNNTIAGAALDVIEDEPAIPPELPALENVIVTPHVASRSPEAGRAGVDLVLENLEAHFSGRPLITPL